MTRPSSFRLFARSVVSLSLLGLSLCGLAGLAACGSSADGAAYYGRGPSGTGLSPGGAQDFGRFKALLDADQIPGPKALDQVGFFAEHKIGTPPTSCRDAVCADGQFGAMANMISGSTCTLLHIGLGTPIDPLTLPRPPIDVAVVVDLSSPDLLVASGLADLRLGLGELINGMDDSDSITLISQGRDVRVLADKVPGRMRDTVRAVLPQLGAATIPTPVEPYDGLRQGVDSLGAAVSGRHRRLIVVSAAKGVGSIRPERSLRLIRSFAQGSGGVTVLALGDVDDLTHLQGLADAGAGTLYYASQTSELPGLFYREVSYSLIPVAEDVVIRLAPGRSYRLREVFGISQSSWKLSAEGGEIRIPALFAAWRKSASTIYDRRGGGGALLVEVLPRADAVNERPATVSSVSVEYNVPGGARQSTSLQVSAPDGPYGTPSSGRFSTPSVEKGFVVLNLYVGLRMASERSAVGDLRGAYDVLDALSRNVDEWNIKANDAEIADDMRYVEKFRDLLYRAGADSLPPRAVQYRDPWPRD